ncbi:MAG TPA: hypothetical protein PK054_08785 [Anaerohalosphaeraceae bacterium]|nr:hypothetical protein [Anaerohalosphaeraceae bacterium]HPP56663.1 hypothetical protein [Anaerohalosphaeraceae bacterium]
MQKKMHQQSSNSRRVPEMNETSGQEWVNLDLDDLLQEPLLEHLQANPIGRLLQLIASLPEVRQEKVLRARREIAENSPDMERRLDAALDRILEELIIEE